MKKVKVIFSALALGMVVLFSCQKEEVYNNLAIENARQINKGLLLKNNILYFDTEETFEKIVNNLHNVNSLDDWEKNINFKSYRTNVGLENQISMSEDIGEEHPFTDLPLATVINDKGCIFIEDWYFKFIVDNKEVRAIKKEFLNEIPLFLNSEITKHTLIFNFDDDIWGELKGNESSKWPWGCDENCANSKTKKYNQQNWTEYCSYSVISIKDKKSKTYNFSVFLKERYDNWGLYRKLYTQFKHKENGGGASDITAFNIGYEYSYKVKCKNTQGAVTHNIPMQPGNPLSPTTYEFTGTNKKIEHYKGTRCLTQFSLSSWASYQSRCSYGMEQIYNIGTITQ